MDFATGEERQAETSPTKKVTLLQRIGVSTCCNYAAPKAVSSAPAPERPGQFEQVSFPSAPVAVALLSDLRGPGRIKSPQNFSGSWMLASIDGNMEAFLIDMDAGYVARSMAAAANFGVGMQRITIAHVTGADEIELQYTGGRTFEQKLHVGRGLQDSFSAAGPIKIDPIWDGGALRLDFKKTDGKEQMRRWIYCKDQNEDRTLVVESATLLGTRIRQIYKPFQ